MIENLDTYEKNEIARHILTGINSFCSGVVHELRSPVQAIDNSISILEHIADESKDVEIALLALKNIQISTKSINNILSSMTAMENASVMDSHDAMTIILKDIKEGSLTKVLREAIEVFQLTTTHKECQSTIELKTPEEVSVEFSEFAVRQVLINLLSNASKSTLSVHGRGKGKISIKLECTKGEISISIIDNGTGILCDSPEKIFLPFYRANVNIPGKGIGLHLSRLWAEYAGMKLSLIDGKPGCTEFRLSIKNSKGVEC